jgi:hypothetical protein
MATTGYDVLSGLKAVPVAKSTAVTPASIAAAQAAVAATEKIAAKTETAAVRAGDPLTNKSVVPPAPAGTTPVWVGGTDTGGWKFQSNTVQGPLGSSAGGQPTGSTGSVPYAPTGPSASDTASRQNIFDQVQALFTTYGIIKPGDPASDALLKTIKDLAMSGAGADTISLQLQQSDAYKARFAGNETRRAAGLNVLSPAEYIATENAYDQILRASGVPTGFYNSSAEKAKLIGADVSASELQSRVDLAAKSISGADPFYTQQLQNLYGLSQGDMIAHVLDPAAAMPLLQQQAQSTTIAAAAARNATNINLTTAQQLAGMGITQAQAEQGFGNIANQLPGMQAIASRYQGYGDAGTVGTGLQAATFGAPVGGETAAQAEARLKRLQTQEVSAFGGSAGASTQGQSLGVGNQQGVQ